jgi:hypothetical protein
MVLTVEPVMGPGEVVPVPTFEVVLGPPQLHQRLSHDGGEAEPRAPAEHSEPNTTSSGKEKTGRSCCCARAGDGFSVWEEEEEGEAKTNSVDGAKKEEQQPTGQASRMTKQSNSREKDQMNQERPVLKEADRC